MTERDKDGERDKYHHRRAVSLLLFMRRQVVFSTAFEKFASFATFNALLELAYVPILNSEFRLLSQLNTITWLSAAIYRRSCLTHDEMKSRSGVPGTSISYIFALVNYFMTSFAARIGYSSSFLE